MFEPLPSGPTKGEHFTDLDGMLDEYYEVSGWDKKTGAPTRATLQRLDMDDIASVIHG